MAGRSPEVIKPGHSPSGLLVRDLAVMITVVAVLYIATSTTIAAVRVVGHSMDPTLSDNDLVLLSKVDYRLHPPERGDIVIVRDPYDPGQDFIKRIVGLPGDQVLIRAGFVYVNSVRLQEPYVVEPWLATTNWPSFPAEPDGETVPPDNYFVLGDNRDNSGDSRLFGYVTSNQIIGKAIARILPLDHAGPLGSRPSLAREP